MARGDMVRWLAQNQITRREDLPAYSGLGYQFDVNLSLIHIYPPAKVEASRY